MTYTLDQSQRDILVNGVKDHLKNTKIFSHFKDALQEPNIKFSNIGLLVDKMSPLQIITAAYKDGFKHIIQNSLQPIDHKISILKKIDQNKESFFDDQFFILENSLFKHKVIFDAATDRKVITELAYSRLNIDPESARSTALTTCLDELLMNAQIDAPKAANTMETKKSTLIIEKSEDLIALSVIDTYGSLDHERFLNRIFTVLNVGVNEAIDFRSQKGAGVGSSLIFDASESLFIGCLPNYKTRVSVVLPLNLSQKKLSDIQKSLFIVI